MSNGPTNNVPKANGMGGVLMTLAGSGNNWVQIALVIGVILNGYWSKSAKTSSAENSTELAALRKQVADQVDEIHENQKFYLQNISNTRAAHNAIMDKLGIAHADP